LIKQKKLKKMVPIILELEQFFQHQPKMMPQTLQKKI